MSRTASLSSRILFFSALASSLLWGLSAGAGESKLDSVQVDTNRRTYVLGDQVEISLENRRGEDIYLVGCQPYQVERFGEDRYLPLPGEDCVAEGEAQAVSAGETKFVFHPAKEHLDVPLRISVVYGIGCSPKRALSQARCRDFGTVRTPSFRVRLSLEEKP
ncbi:MAG: hypothetical protein CMP23_02560 [Rickettsiales bacterium]|nr:hypothetical protein [Rickettsiales bacterium]